MSALVIGKNMDNVENSEFSTFCGKLVAEGNSLAVRSDAPRHLPRYGFRRREAGQKIKKAESP